MSKLDKPIERGGLFIISYQFEGLCNGLRLTVPHGLSPGKETVAILKKLVVDFSEMAKGRVVKDLPTISESANPVGILVMAETLRTSVLAFLSPEEVAEHRRIGFQADNV
jgi:hypothetical protein